MKLRWHNYRYFPYERDLALREVEALLSPLEIMEEPDGLRLVGDINSDAARRLVYFAETHSQVGRAETTQALMEQSVRGSTKRQATRYSVHGLHEYKGKFNPQVVKALLNIFGFAPGQRLLDPFCGSGTTLVECSQLGIHGLGTDLNPLAVLVSNAKLLALQTPAEELSLALAAVRAQFEEREYGAELLDARGVYLLKWFEPEILNVLERLRMAIKAGSGALAPVFLVIASNMLRDYSLQEPSDLRIRRRTTPLPSSPFETEFFQAAEGFVSRLAKSQAVLEEKASPSKAVLGDVGSLDNSLFDGALTSPPYAMALPYIDTQRLSLVWTGLAAPDQIASLDAQLTGSRELKVSSRRGLRDDLLVNFDQLPANQFALCQLLESRLGEGDGFRRQVVPILLYRYFRDMMASFKAVRMRLKPGAPYALIVGHNHTTIGGIREDIDTPKHLADLAKSVGWKIEELVPLQTYKRFGLHSTNAVNAETLMMLRNQDA